ncbi:hypothetical protein SCP_0904760 [Sparassis crispa]|uniref:Uncharacterized protein n=1 Tax=Sparassis crispa TaxID=139825 RepID=A0A401GWJ3_9APHY|nr:hypothetical protein SCP_0904760 [Sparassis crispa]GBE86597.1 hypothetical protein SCP_0904760 [Sparassis crispa]
MPSRVLGITRLALEAVLPAEFEPSDLALADDEDVDCDASDTNESLEAGDAGDNTTDTDSGMDVSDKKFCVRDSTGFDIPLQPLELPDVHDFGDREDPIVLASTVCEEDIRQALAQVASVAPPGHCVMQDKTDWVRTLARIPPSRY